MSETRVMRAFAVWVLLLGAAPVWASEGEALSAIHKGNDRFRELLGKKVAAGSPEEQKLAAQLASDMHALFDVRDLAQRALVDHWPKLSRAQQEDFVDTLQKLVEKSYIKQLRTNLKYEVVYAGEEPSPEGGSVLVKTVIKSEHNGRPLETKVDYLMHKDGASWRVFDVLTDEVGMIRNYRSQFNRIVAKNGLDGLMQKMHQKLTED